MKKSLYAVLISLTLVAALNAEKMKVAVYDFSSSDSLKESAFAAGILFRKMMIESGQFAVLDRSENSAVAKEKKHQISGATSTEGLVRHDKELNAKYAIEGKMIKVGNNYNLSVMMYNVETAENIFSDSAECNSLAQVEWAAAYLTVSLIKSLNLKVTISVPEKPQPKPSEEPKKVELKEEDKKFLGIKDIIVFPFETVGSKSVDTALLQSEIEAELIFSGVQQNIYNLAKAIKVYKAYNINMSKSTPPVDPERKCRSLGIDAYVTGRIFKRSDSYRVYVNVYDTFTGTVIGSMRYNEDSLSDISLLIAENVAGYISR